MVSCRPAIFRRLRFLICRRDDVPCLPGGAKHFHWAGSQGLLNRLFNLPHRQEESALPSFGPKGFLYLVGFSEGLK